MDASELEEIAFHRQNGRPETTRGPYYHKTWWESYKGAVKGILGGIMVGGLVGALAGGAVIGALLATGTIAVTQTGLIGGMLAATTLFGMYEGEQKFEKVGITTGAVAAAQEISEVRMKEYMRDKLTELTNEVRELKAAIGGKIPVEAMHMDAAREDTAAIFDESDFRSTHQTSEHPGTKGKIVFWNVAAIGGVVGAAVGTIAAFATPIAGIPEAIIEFLSTGGAETATGLTAHAAGGAAGHAAASMSVGAYTAIIASGAALGASFGINRDIFRKIFDVTDCWFMGVANGKCAEKEIAEAKGVEYEPLAPKRPHELAKRQQMLLEQQAAQAKDNAPSAEISNVYIVEPQTTYFQEKPSPEVTKLAILGLDHTNAIRH